MLANFAIAFAIMVGQPTVLDYRGNLTLPYDPRFANEISFDDARRRIERGNPPILFALVGGPVKRATKSQAIGLLRKWGEQKELRRKGKPAGRFKVRDPARYKPAKESPTIGSS